MISALSTIEDRAVADLGPDQARGRASVRFAAGVAPWGLAFGVAFVLFDQPLLAVSMFAACCGVASAPLLLRATGSTAVVAHWMNAWLAQGLFLGAWCLGGVVAACVPWLLVTVVTASYLSGPRAGLAWAGISTLGVGGLLVLHLSGALPEPMAPPTVIWVLATGADSGLMLVGFVLVTAAVAVDARARAELERANAAKSEFLAQMSHELRTPMNAVLGYAELLAEDASDEQRADLERIRIAGGHLLDLINDVLDLSKVSSGRMEFAPSAVDLVATARAVVDATEPLLRARGNRATVDADGPALVVADPMRTRQVLLNLVSNAAKFTRDGAVRVGFERGPRETVVYVEDTGIGIPADRLDAIFDPFAQASAEVQRTYGGTGLGLALVRQFVERMGGRVTVRSELGRGSRFAVALPAAPVTPEA